MRQNVMINELINPTVRQKVRICSFFKSANTQKKGKQLIFINEINMACKISGV